MHWVLKYLNKPWAVGAEGPDSYDCWGLVRRIEIDEYHRPMPAFPDAIGQPQRWVAKQFRKAELSGEWIRIAKPVDGCLTAMGTHNFFHHCGVYIKDDGGVVVHSYENAFGVVAQPLRDLTTKFMLTKISFYLHQSWPTS